MKHGQTDERFRLDPCKFPQRVDLDLPEEVVIKVERLAARTGRCFSEVAIDLISSQIHTQN